MAAVMKNVSVTEMLADTDAIFIVKRPVSSGQRREDQPDERCGDRSQRGQRAENGERAHRSQ